MLPKKVLLVEDDTMLSSIMSQKLTVAGFSVRAAYDGESAVKMALDFIPDLILLDLLLPKKDGFAVLEELKQDPKTSDIVIIVLSNLGKPEDIQKAKDRGAVDFLVKVQMVPNDVIERITSLLSNNSDT